MSNLVEHAKRELALIGEDPDVIDGYLKVIQAFSDMGHSGGSASVAIPVINELLNFRPLSELTDNPDEWIKVYEDMVEGQNLWQSRRDPAAFSKDGGKTYTLVGSTDAPRKTINNRKGG